MIKIPIHVLNAGWTNFDGVEPASFLEVGDTETMRFPAEVKYALKVQLVNNGVLVEGRVSTWIRAQCGRCLVEFEREIVNDGVCHFYEDPPQDVLDISEDIREDLLLAIPGNPLCDENCRGLCPDCGANLNEKECGCRGRSTNSGIWKDLDDLKFEK
ncbi:MAG: DUF177 domain-containing protein [Victivallales bacterium]|nr:DUF177 domain-containing protein [Victivallales bacterium]